MKFLSRLLAAVILLALLAGGAALYIVWPTVDIPLPGTPPRGDMTAYLQEAVIDTATVNVDIMALSVSAEALITADKLTTLLDYAFQDAPARVRDRVTGYRIVPREGYADIYLRVRYLPFLEGEARLSVVPSYANGNLTLTIADEHIGRLRVRTGTLVAYAAPELADPKHLSVNVGRMDPVRVDSISMENGGMRVELSASVRSLEDLVELGRAFGATLN